MAPSRRQCLVPVRRLVERALPTPSRALNTVDWLLAAECKTLAPSYLHQRRYNHTRHFIRDGASRRCHSGTIEVMRTKLMPHASALPCHHQGSASKTRTTELRLASVFHQRAEVGERDAGRPGTRKRRKRHSSESVSFWLGWDAGRALCIRRGPHQHQSRDVSCQLPGTCPLADAL